MSTSLPPVAPLVRTYGNYCPYCMEYMKAGTKMDMGILHLKCQYVLEDLLEWAYTANREWPAEWHYIARCREHFNERCNEVHFL